MFGVKILCSLDLAETVVEIRTVCVATAPTEHSHCVHRHRFCGSLGSNRKIKHLIPLQELLDP